MTVDSGRLASGAISEKDGPESKGWDFFCGKKGWAGNFITSLKDRSSKRSKLGVWKWDLRKPFLFLLHAYNAQMSYVPVVLGPHYVFLTMLAHLDMGKVYGHNVLVQVSNFGSLTVSNFVHFFCSILCPCVLVKYAM